MNLLVNPDAINLAPWSVTGTGASALSATTLQCGSADTSLAQSITLTPTTTYTLKITLSTVSGALGSAVLNLYDPDYNWLGGSDLIELTNSPQAVTCEVTVGAGITEGIFEVDYSPNAAGAVQRVTGASISPPSVSVQRLALLGCGA
jgi:hypothetical protein